VLLGTSLAVGPLLNRNASGGTLVPHALGSPSMASVKTFGGHDMPKFGSRYPLWLVGEVRGLVVTIATVLVLSRVGAYAQHSQQTPEARIVVTGEGNVSMMPSYALISSGVTTRSRTVKEGIEANSRLMIAIIAALKQAGIADNDVQTARFSIQPVYASQEPRTEPKLSGYTVSNQVNVTVRDIGKTSDVLDRVVAAGATDVANVAFLVSDASRVLDQARQAAMADAHRKAEVYAKAAGVELGRVEWIIEDSGVPQPPSVMARAQVVSVPIAIGEDTLRVHITVGFNIAR
jgi:uncharacterized protein